MKFSEPIKEATWEKLKDPLFKYLARKIKHGTKRYKFLGSVHRAWMNFDWGYAEQQYLSYVQEFYGHFYIYGLNEQVPLNELSTDIFLKYPPKFRKSITIRKSRRISGLRMVFNKKEGQKLFIWGKPGEGKTTFLKQVAQAAITLGKIPLFISIAEWVELYPPNMDGLLEYLAMQFEDCGIDHASIFISFIIDQGISVLLFDGLDEIRSSHRENVHLLLSRLQNSKSQVLITCRIDATQNQLEGFVESQIEEWDRQRINDFVTKMIPNFDVRSKFFKELDNSENKSLRNLTSNPLLLSMLCVVFDPLEGFPKNRCDIYANATRYLISDRDKEKEIPVNREDIHNSLTKSQFEALYAQLAYITFEKEEVYFKRETLESYIGEILNSILGKEISKCIDPSILLPKLVSHHGILSRRSYRSYSFAHLTFQEYFSAKYIVDQGMYKQLASHLIDPRWREVFLLTANLQ